MPPLLPAARPVYTAVELLLTTISAELVPPLEPGFQPSMVPWSVSKMNVGGNAATGTWDREVRGRIEDLAGRAGR